MASQDSFGAKGTLDVDGQSYEIYRLDAVKGEGLDVESLPFSLKVLLENLLRTEDGENITAGASGLILVASPPSSAIASRMVARSTTQGTPVKSCMITRAGVKDIS